jgi:hypothetical protein
MDCIKNAILTVDGTVLSTRRKDSCWLVLLYEDVTIVERISGHRAAWCREFEVRMTPIEDGELHQLGPEPVQQIPNNWTESCG